MEKNSPSPVSKSLEGAIGNEVLALSLLQALDQLESELTFDFAFIDADKSEYDAYYERILPRIRTNGVILFDNMFLGGMVLEGLSDYPNAQALRSLNAKLASDERVECVLLPIADGIQLCRKR